ncbi:MAG: hypothetical protein KatS3mg109_1335 [Pirellulaceae bacterium]|nr:MAG: hypothetical protein KatS3mg109_1197 [Pirellulaceae bacterium]GIW90903.1 MAG: hypothetical protein KatS3mg109_1335 [Pirellulaceae bacterium]
MIVQCAWCQQTIRTIPEDPPDGEESISHGCCDHCATRLLEEWEREDDPFSSGPARLPGDQFE